MISGRPGSDRVHTRLSIGGASSVDPLPRSPSGAGEETLILTNARVVTCDRAFIGTVEVLKQHIVAVYRGPTALSGAIDVDGDYLLPGLIELHSSNIYRHLLPRPGLRSSVLSAVLAHDAEMISAGITTAFEHLQCGDGRPCLSELAIGELAAVFQLADRSGLTRSDHRLVQHRNAEEGCPHVPPDPHHRSGAGNEANPSEPCPGVCVFPAALALAQAARAARQKVMVAATSLIGESVASGATPQMRQSALSMAAENLVDILSSDDYPPSLLQGAFRLHQSPLRMTLSESIATVSATPARVAGLTDRGEIAPGKRADLIRVRAVEALPVTREVWRAGVRVY